MDIENNLNQTNNINQELVTEKNQNSFLESALGKTINTAMDIGLRWVLPDLIEDEIIDIKDSLVKGGLKEGINTTINKAINLGKSAIGIFTGKFDSISQAQSAVKTGGIIDGVSNVIDIALNKTTKLGLIDKNVSTLIKKGKNVILDNVSKNKKNYQINLIIICMVGVLVSNIGFSNLVQILYPLFGILGFIQIIFLLNRK